MTLGREPFGWDGGPAAYNSITWDKLDNDLGHILLLENGAFSHVWCSENIRPTHLCLQVLTKSKFKAEIRDHGFGNPMQYIAECVAIDKAARARSPVNQEELGATVLGSGLVKKLIKNCFDADRKIAARGDSPVVTDAFKVSVKEVQRVVLESAGGPGVSAITGRTLDVTQNGQVGCAAPPRLACAT
jgi:hypothetical protein